MRGQPILGEPIRLQVTLLGVEKQKLDAACFRLVQPASSDGLPWLRKAALVVRGGNSPLLEIRSEMPLREPIMQMTLLLSCGHEISKDYIIMASPSVARENGPFAASVPQEVVATDGVPKLPEQRPFRIRPPAPPKVDDVPERLAPRKMSRRASTVALPDRLVLAGDDGAPAGEPSLRIATELLTATVAKESQREILRLEYRMLMALHEQAASQMATAEKLRNMEGTLAELQARAAEFAQRVERDGAQQAGATPLAPPSVPAPIDGRLPETNPPPPPAVRQTPPSAVVTDDPPWGVYGAALGIMLGLGGWFAWRRYRDAREDVETGAQYLSLPVPEMRVDPVRVEESPQSGEIDLHVEPVATAARVDVDLDLDLGGGSAPEPVAVERPADVVPARGPDSVMSISATTLDEHFEANPVMELADIMLSFGRVKGAAQALQEFIDHNPEEALQPWIRLMDVYRMAGMRSEFETVARNLNQHFNVEVQSWDSAPASFDPERTEFDRADLEIARPQSLEDMPRLMNTVLDQWADGDVVGYLYQLLRDNRGGQRQGFALPVVEDILFLIELKETANRME